MTNQKTLHALTKLILEILYENKWEEVKKQLRQCVVCLGTLETNTGEKCTYCTEGYRTELSLAHILEALNKNKKSKPSRTYYSGSICSIELVEGKGGIYPICNWQLLKDNQPIPLDKQEPEVYKSLLKILTK